MKRRKIRGRSGAHGTKPIFFATESTIYKLVCVGPFLSLSMVFLFYPKRGFNIVELMNMTPKTIWTAVDPDYTAYTYFLSAGCQSGVF